MKKRMLIAGVLALAVLLVACGAGAEDRNGGTSGAASQALEASGAASQALEASSAEGTTTSSAVPEESSEESDAAAASGGESSVTSDAGSQTESGNESEETPGVEASGPEEQSKDTSSSSGANQQQPDSSHTHSYKKTVVNPTCTEKGYTKYTCSCGDSYTGDEKPKVEHQFIDIDVRQEVFPTQTTRGICVYKCAYGCGEAKTVELYSYVELGRLISDYALKYINQYRAKEGAPKFTVSKKLTELSEYRGQQALQGKEHRGHNETDIALAAEATKCGEFYDFTNYMGFTTPHWVPDGQEAWWGGTISSWVEVGNTSTAETVGKRIADGFRGSSGHWAYVGGKSASYKDYIYVGVGVSVDSAGYANCYVSVNDYNQDVIGYKRYYIDENGDLQIDWVKP